MNNCAAEEKKWASPAQNLRRDWVYPARRSAITRPVSARRRKLFDALQVDPNYLYRDSFRAAAGAVCSREELRLLEKIRCLSLTGRQTVYALVDSLGLWQSEMESELGPTQPRVIPLYRSPAAAGYAAPVFGEDFEPLTVTGDVPPGAELAVRIQGDSMEPVIADGSVVYVNHDPLQNGDVGIFCVDGDMLCKQYYKDPLGVVYLFSLNRRRADAHDEAGHHHKEQGIGQGGQDVAQGEDGNAQKQSGSAADQVTDLAQDRCAGGGGHGLRQRCPCGVIVGNPNILHKGWPQNRRKAAYKPYQKGRQCVWKKSFFIIVFSVTNSSFINIRCDRSDF